MSAKPTASNSQRFVLFIDGGEFVPGRMNFALHDGKRTPERILARCDEFLECFGLVRSLGNDTPSIAEKLKKKLVRLGMSLAGDAKTIGVPTLPLDDFGDHMSSEPAEWYGWQFLAAVKTVREIKAKVTRGDKPEETAKPSRRSVTLDEKDFWILRVYANRGIFIPQEDVVSALDHTDHQLSLRTISPRLVSLRKKRLICHPRGKRYTDKITQKGLDLLAKSPVEEPAR
jgi:hypothetical protein